MNRFEDAGLPLQPDKCEFLRREVAYSGHIVGRDGLRMDFKKMRAVEKFPTLRSQKNVRQFLGLAGYYRRFIPGFSDRVKPLFDTLRKGLHFNWGLEQRNSFNDLRKALSKEPILQYPDINKQFVLTTDASDIALGSILSQDHDGHDLLIAYHSRVLTKAERSYSATDKECLAIIDSIEHFSIYSYGKTFKLVSDHEPLNWIRTIDDPGKWLTRWKLRTRRHDYEFVYEAGKLNVNADAFSRNPVISGESSSDESIDEPVRKSLPIKRMPEQRGARQEKPRDASFSNRAGPSTS